MEASQLLESINALQLRKTLDYLAEEQVHTTYEDLLSLARDSGAGVTEAKAEELCKALVTAGVVLRYKDVVYLRPDEISEMVLSSLPHKQKDVERKLEQLKKELEPLMAEKKDIQDKATGKSSVYLTAGLLFLLTQFGAFYWLTFYELSWDVMEPVAYFFSLGYGILTYIYFLIQRQDFDYLGFRRKLEADHENQEEKKRKFDERKFKKLTKAIDNYEKYHARFYAHPSRIDWGWFELKSICKKIEILFAHVEVKQDLWMLFVYNK